MLFIKHFHFVHRHSPVFFFLFYAFRENPAHKRRHAPPNSGTRDVIVLIHSNRIERLFHRVDFLACRPVQISGRLHAGGAQLAEVRRRRQIVDKRPVENFPHFVAADAGDAHAVMDAALAEQVRRFIDDAAVRMDAAVVLRAGLFY